MSLAGVIPMVSTTFRDDGSLDLESQRRLVRFLIDAGAHGLGLFGTAGEGYTLSHDERLTLLRAIVREVDGRIPVVVSSGHTGTDVAVAQSRLAEAEGADAVMVLPPYYYRADPEGILAYFAAINDGVTVPIVVQDAPLMTQVMLPAAFLARMARELERVRYVKVEAPPTAPKVTEIRQLAEDSLSLFGGLNGQFLLEELDRGASGSMPGSDLTAMFVRIWQAWSRGDAIEARQVFTRGLPMIRYELQPGLGVAVMKHNLHASGVIASTRVRQPTRTLDDRSRREVDAWRTTLEPDLHPPTGVLRLPQ